MNRAGPVGVSPGSADPAGPPDGLATPQRYWALAGLWTGMAMSVIDSSIANIALPSIARDLSVAPATTTWVVTAYQIAIVMTLLPVAALGERLGYVRIYLAGQILFVLMSLGCALSVNLEMLAACRFVQGLGAAAMMGVNGALMRHTWPKALLGRGIGYNAVVVSCTAAAGPALAGFILSLADWPWLFLVNVPFGIVALVLLMRCGPRTPAVSTHFDWGDALLNALMFGALFLAFSDGVHGRWSMSLGLMILVGAVAGSWLLWRSRMSPRPLIPLDLLRMPRLRLAYGASVCAFSAQMAMLVTLPFYLEGERHLDAAAVGLLVLPLPLAIATTSPIAGRLAERSWAGRMSAVGLLLCALATGLLALFLPRGLPLYAVALVMIACGAGFGLFQSPNNNVMLRGAPLDRAGAAAGMQATCRLLGQTFGALMAALSLRLLGPGSLAPLALATLLSLGSAAFARAR